MARNCPDCSEEMTVESVGDIRIDVCPKCAGTWFDPEELRTLLARDPLALSVVEDLVARPVEQKAEDPPIGQEAVGPSFRHCPDCEMPLEKYHYLYTSPVLLHTCTDCGGFWVEDGELNRMQEWLEDAHHPVSAKEKAGLVVADAMIEHDKEMQRQNRLLRLFTVLQRFRPGWIGLAP